MIRSPRIGCWGAALVALAWSCAGPPAGSQGEVVVIHVSQLPSSPADDAWGAAPVYPAELLLQDMVEPRLLDPSTTLVNVRALTDGTDVAFRLDWSDATRDDLPGAARFSDACAIQLPQRVAADVPAPQMGEPGRGVEIAFWRASWQAAVDGRPDDIRALFPGATVDHYPFEAASLTPGSAEQSEMETRYAPAQALGNRMEGPRDRPVEDLLAEGPGTLTRAAEQRSTAEGRRSGNGWEVVIRRPLPSALGSGSRGQVAFAIWQGIAREVGSRKMRTGWVPIAIEGGS